MSVKELLIKHKDVFSDQPGCTSVHEHDLRLTVEKTFVRKSYPVSLHKRAAVDREIEKKC